MAGPITWQSIRTTAGEPADAMRPLAGAQQSFNGVFDGLQNILNQRLAVEQSNNGAVQDAYKQNYLDQLQGAKTPEELAALQPTLEQARAALSPTNRAAVRGADEARTTGLRQQVTAGQTYDAGQVAYNAIPLKDQIAALVTQGKGAEAMELAKTLPERAGRAEIMSGVTKAQRTLLLQGREDTTFNLGTEKTNADIASIKGQLVVAEKNASTNESRVKLDAFNNAEESVRKFQADMTAKAGRFVGHEAANKQVSEAIEKMYPKDQDKRDAMRSAAGKVMAANPGIPVSIMLEQIAAENPGQFYHFDSSEGSGLADRVKAAVGKRDFRAENKLTEAADAMRLDNLRRQAAALGGGAAVAAPSLPSRLQGGDGDSGAITYPPTPADGAGPDDEPVVFVPTAPQGTNNEESANLALRVKLEKSLKAAGQLKAYSPAVVAALRVEKTDSEKKTTRLTAQEQAILDAARAAAEERASSRQVSLGSVAQQTGRNAALAVMKRQLEALDKADAAAKKAR